ncbi:MAG: glycosyltransferase [Flavobacteriia bacterium]|nr:glycosyltransferase [Flavobacteriia bacterium]
MKILQIIPSLAKGGAERIVLDTSIELSKREGVQLKLVTFHETNAYSFLSKTIDHQVIKSSVVPSLKGKNKINIKELQALINQFQPDVIHSHLFESEMVLSQIRLKSTKHIVHFHDNMIQFQKIKLSKNKIKQTITNWYERKIVTKAYRNSFTRFIAISKDTENYIKKNLPSNFQTDLLHNAINTSVFQISGMSHRENKIVNIGSLVDKKGQSLAIDVIAELKQKGYSISLDILGDGKNRAQLQNQIDDLKLSDNVSLHGNVDHPEDFLKHAKIYLHTAIYEPFGLVLLEAMSAGLPIVCTDAGGNRDIIEHGKNGYIFQERNPEILANQIIELLENESKRQEIGGYAQNYAQNYDIKNYVNQLMKIYKE